MARQMKDSGIPYLGPVPASWDVQKLRYSVKWKSEKGYPDAEVLALYRDYGVIPKSSRDDNYNVTSLDTSTYKYVEVGDFVINKMKAWQGSMGISPYSGIISPAYHVCAITNEDIHRPYFHYLLRNVGYLPEFARLSTGLRIGQWDLSFDDFRNLPFLLPDKPEQERIANLLDTRCADIDKVIEQTCATIEEYKKLKQAIITEAVTKGVRGARPMKPSGVEWIGDIPEEWNVCSIKLGVSKVGSGKTPSGGAEVYLNEGVLFHRSQNIYDTGLQLDNATYISESTDEEMSSTRVYAGDVLLNITGGSIGRCCVYPADLPPANVNQHVCIIRTVNSIFTADYMHYFWISFAGKTSIQLYQTGGNREGMSADAIKNTLIPRMDISEQQEITIYLDTKCAEIDRIIQKKEQLIEELGSYKKSLIYEYVTGKKEVTA